MKTMREILSEIRDDATNASLLAADRAILSAIESARDQRHVAQLIREYYGDLDRANRTPRAYLYMHLGMLIGITMDERNQ